MTVKGFEWAAPLLSIPPAAGTDVPVFYPAEKNETRKGVTVQMKMGVAFPVWDGASYYGAKGCFNIPREAAQRAAVEAAKAMGVEIPTKAKIGMQSRNLVFNVHLREHAAWADKMLMRSCSQWNKHFYILANAWSPPSRGGTKNGGLCAVLLLSGKSGKWKWTLDKPHIDFSKSAPAWFRKLPKVERAGGFFQCQEN